jgi:predicted metal-dependent HD superfamily phosphohydrolase
VIATEQFVAQLLNIALDKELTYHNLLHTLAVRDAAVAIAQMLDLTDKELEIIELACLLHDTGFTEIYNGHEAVSHRIAKQFLTEQHYPADTLQKVLQCIDVTASVAHPTNMMEQIIKDADYVNLSSENYLESIGALRHEWAHFLDQNYTDKEWLELNYEFLKSHQYFTPAARQIFEPQKELNRKALKKMVKKDKKPPIVLTSESGVPEVAISDSKSASMMFKTSLRNHLDLSNLADNKANIMLSVNALIITVAIPLVSSYAQQVGFIIPAMATLIVSCLVSMIYATLATRPIKMDGYTAPEKIEAGESNLFFFGNFYSMTFEEYQKGMMHVISDEKDLDNTIMRDLFFLGRSLGKKYRQLRYCYNIFMIGVVTTVFVFTVCFIVWGRG